MEELIEELEKKSSENIEDELLDDENLNWGEEKIEGFVNGYKWAFELAISIVQENSILFKKK